MNETARDWILTKVVYEQPEEAEVKVDDDYVQTPVERRVAALEASVPGFFQCGKSTASIDGPIWMRDYSKPPNQEPKEKVGGMVDDVLKALDVDRLVVGHTVQNGVNSVLEGKVWRVDIGTAIRSGYTHKYFLEDYMHIKEVALQATRCEDGTEEMLVVKM
jgi:hypothetical protein